MADEIQNAVESPFLTFEAVGKMFDKSVKTIGRWVQNLPDFPQPVRVGCSRLFLTDEMAVFVEKLRDKRDRKKKKS